MKFAFSHYLEDDIDICLDAGVDFLALEGAEAATVGAPPILEDDFGLPTLIGLCRAVEHLKAKEPEGRVSLIVGGGFTSQGQCLKALALGQCHLSRDDGPLCRIPHAGAQALP